jgi:DNA-directed RNA polymerase subunit RPC12/RpoP
MAYQSGNCPRCGVKINFQDSSIGTWRRCQRCGQEFELKAAPGIGCIGNLVALLVLGVLAVSVCGGLVVWFAPSADSSPPAPAAKAPTITSHAERPAPPVEEPKPAPEVRTWSDKSGKFSTEATFGGMAGSTVTLHKPDGAAIKIQLDQLSDSDKAWIEERRKGH